MTLPPEKVARARDLRNHATIFERRLWAKLNNRQMGGWRFRRQHPIGPYVLDFYSPELQLAIELDGDQHGRPLEILRDAQRAEFLARAGVIVLRFWNNELEENLHAVLETIYQDTEVCRQRLGLDQPARRPREQTRPPTRRQIRHLEWLAERGEALGVLSMGPDLNAHPLAPRAPPLASARGGRGGAAPHAEAYPFDPIAVSRETTATTGGAPGEAPPLPPLVKDEGGSLLGEGRSPFGKGGSSPEDLPPSDRRRGRGGAAPRAEAYPFDATAVSRETALACDRIQSGALPPLETPSLSGAPPLPPLKEGGRLFSKGGGPFGEKGSQRLADHLRLPIADSRLPIPESRFPFPEPVLRKLTIFDTLLIEETARHNLIARSTIEDRWRRHFEDSAQIHEALDPGTRTLVDLGSGAGFPGLVLAAMGEESGLQVTLVESIGKKARFLSTAATAMDLKNVTIIPERIESLRLSPPDAITARALAPLAKLLAYAHEIAGKKTVCYFLKGQDVGAELTEAAIYWSMSAEQRPSRTQEGASLLIIRALAPKTAAKARKGKHK